MAPSLNRVERALVEVTRDLGAERIAYALVGGLAVAARAEPRTTRDIDLAISVPDDLTAEDVVRRLRHRRFEVRAIVEQTSAKRLSTARLVRTSDPNMYVDLLFASSGIEQEVVAAAGPVEVVQGLTVPVATRAHLIALKVLSRDDRRRPQDRGDLEGLLAGANDADLDEVRTAMRLIVSRGYGRGRDLPTLLDDLLRELHDGRTEDAPG